MVPSPSWSNSATLTPWLDVGAMARLGMFVVCCCFAGLVFRLQLEQVANTHSNMITNNIRFITGLKSLSIYMILNNKPPYGNNRHRRAKKFGACVSTVNGFCLGLFVFSHALGLDSGAAQRAGVQKRTGARIGTPAHWISYGMKWSCSREANNT